MSLPLISSSPMLSKPTRGLSCAPSKSAASTEPITANCDKCSGVHEALAPRSSIYVCPPRDGMSDTMAGRSTPGSIFSTKCAVAINAPVLPALPHDQGKPYIAEFTGCGQRRRNGYRGPVIAAHGVDVNMEQRRHSASKKHERRADRRQCMAYSSAA